MRTKLSTLKGPVYKEGGYPSKRVNPSWGQKIARVYKQNFKGRVTLQSGTTECAVTLKGSVNK